MSEREMKSPDEARAFLKSPKGKRLLKKMAEDSKALNRQFKEDRESRTLTFEQLHTPMGPKGGRWPHE